MGLYESILLPTDGSAGTERAIEHAGALARVHGGTVHALYVVDATNFTGLPMETSYEGLRSVLESDGETALEEVERLLADVPVETHTVEGTPSTEIVRFARENDVDVVVMGTHGRAGLDRLLLGSVAERVVRKSRVPVVTVRVAGTDGEQAPANGVELDDADAEETPVEDTDQSPVDPDEVPP